MAKSQPNSLRTIVGKFLKENESRATVHFFSGAFMALILITSLNFPKIQSKHSSVNPYWASKKFNTELYKKLDTDLGPEPHIVINLKSFEDMDMMFYSKHYAYHWWPDAAKLDSLIDLGYKAATFPNHHDQNLPLYFANHPKIKMLEPVLK